MDILNLGNGDSEHGASRPTVRKSKKLKAAIGIGGLATMTGVGSTLAAQLTLNNNANVEFGQGVAQTAACDNAAHGGGFTITPKTTYVNQGEHLFHVTSIQIDGLNLTPQGTGYSDAGYYSQAEAVADHPGEYYSGGQWVPTCDGVVLDFSAYTDNSDFSSLSADNNISNPLYLINQNEYSGGAYLTNFAFKFNHSDNSYQVKYAQYPDSGSHDSFTSNWWVEYNGTSTDNAQVIVTFNSWYGVDSRAVSRITVESLPNFPSSYSTRYDDGI